MVTWKHLWGTAGKKNPGFQLSLNPVPRLELESSAISEIVKLCLLHCFSVFPSFTRDCLSSTKKMNPWTALWTELTLTSSCADVWNETTTTRVWLGRAHLTGVTPGSSHSGTAECFCADNPTELTLAHLVADHGKTWARPVIWKQRAKMPWSRLQASF